MTIDTVSHSIKVNIFDFTNFRDYLMVAGFPSGNYNGRLNTLQKWANRLGYRSASSLNMVLKGNRSPSREMQRALIKDLRLSSREAEYFELMIENEKYTKKGKCNAEILERLSSITGGNDSYKIPLKEFSLISRWYFLVIKQLISTPGFIEDVDWIHQKLRKKVSKRNISDALSILEELKLAVRDDSGALVATDKSLKITSLNFLKNLIINFSLRKLQKFIN